MRLIRHSLRWLFVLAFPLLSRAQTVVQRPVSENRVTFYTEPNFKGEALTIEAGAQVGNLDTLKRSNQRPWTFAISSVRVEGAARAIVQTGLDFSGERLEISQSISDLYAARRPPLPGRTWDRSIASISVLGPQPAIVTAPPAPPEPTTVYVRPPLPPVHEIRPRISRSEADAVITRAYLDVLDRRPDAEGLRHYRERLMQEGWTERQLIQTLQRSAEAQAINPDEAITRLYRDVLGRDPDPSGLAHYRQKWREGWTRGAIREDLAHSKEGREVVIKNTINRTYREVLGRDPDPSGFATYERLLRENRMSERDLREALMRSEEYRQRQASQPGGDNRNKRR